MNRTLAASQLCFNRAHWRLASSSDFWPNLSAILKWSLALVSPPPSSQTWSRTTPWLPSKYFSSSCRWDQRKRWSRCLNIILPQDGSPSITEYFSVLVNMEMSLHSMEVEKLMIHLFHSSFLGCEQTDHSGWVAHRVHPPLHIQLHLHLWDHQGQVHAEQVS